MVIPLSRTFVYGSFMNKADALRLRRGEILGLPPRPEVAIEILREFSASEFIGKTYVQAPGGSWQQVTHYGISNYEWFKEFSKGRLYFKMQDGDFWDVLHFRKE